MQCRAGPCQLGAGPGLRDGQGWAPDARQAAVPQGRESESDYCHDPFRLATRWVLVDVPTQAIDELVLGFKGAKRSTFGIYSESRAKIAASPTCNLSY